MTNDEIQEIITMCEAIPGYPSKFEKGHTQLFLIALGDVPSNLLGAVKLKLALATERPAAGLIRQWANEASPKPAYQPPRPALPAPESVEDVMAMFEGRAFPKNQPQIARDIIANVRRRMAEDEKQEKATGKKHTHSSFPDPGSPDYGEYGIKYAYCNGKFDYYPCRYSEAAAQIEAERRQERLVGVVVSTYRFGAVPDNAVGMSSTRDFKNVHIVDTSTLKNKPKEWYRKQAE